MKNDIETHRYRRNIMDKCFRFIYKAGHSAFCNRQGHVMRGRVHAKDERSLRQDVMGGEEKCCSQLEIIIEHMYKEKGL